MPLALLLATMAVPSPAPAQGHDRDLPIEGVPGHVALLGANAAVSGLTSGLLRWWRGGSFRDGFVGGAVGGAAVYAGKVVAVQPHGGLAGRQLAAVGASAVRNTALGEPMLSSLTLPLGPIRLQVRPEPGADLRISVDLAGVVALAGAFVAYDARVDWRSTLTTGAPVLLVRDAGLSWHGRHLWGNLLISDLAGAPGARHYPRVLAHETVHVLQYDHLLILWSEPAEAVLLDAWAPGRGLERHVYLGIHVPLGSAIMLLPERWNPLEVEAHFLADTWNYHGAAPPPGTATGSDGPRSGHRGTRR